MHPIYCFVYTVVALNVDTAMVKPSHIILDLTKQDIFVFIDTPAHLDPP